MLKRGIEVGVAHPVQELARGSTHWQGDEAFLNVTNVSPQVQFDHGFDGSPTISIQNTSFAQVIGQRPTFVACPALEGGNKLRLVDEPNLKCNQSEEQMAFGIGGHGNLRDAGRCRLIASDLGV